MADKPGNDLLNNNCVLDDVFALFMGRDDDINEHVNE